MRKIRETSSGKTGADQDVVDKLVRLLKGYEAVHTAYLFGSRARGTQGMASDVDVAVAFAPRASAWDEVELQEQLAAQLGVPVQVVDLARADTHVLEAVHREGIRLVGDVQGLPEELKAVEEEGTEGASPNAQTHEAIWLLESAADKVRWIDRALPLLADVSLEAVLTGEMTAVRDFLGVFMLLIEPLETLMRRISRYAHVVLGYPGPEATLRAQTTLAAQVMGVSAAAVEGIGAMARLRGQLAHAYWELDAEALQPLAPQHLQPHLEHLVERASRFVLVEQVRWQRRDA